MGDPTEHQAGRSPHPTVFGLQMTLDEFGVPLPPPDAYYALGRLAALEFASALGVRTARRALSRERQTLIRRCFPSLSPVSHVGGRSRSNDDR
jgi:hypothetical protein